MGSVNVRRDMSDQFYRYKMPALATKIEGKGNGIKTVIPNMVEIAKSLHRPPSYPTKFFGCELGSQVKCDDKNNRYVVNGAHDTSRLQELLDGFISKFVLCSLCKNPETTISITRDSVVVTECKACGEKAPVDQTHKLIPFIIKSMATRAKSKAPKEKDRSHTTQKEDQEQKNEESDNDWAEDMSEDAVARRRDEQLANLPIRLRESLGITESKSNMEMLVEYILGNRPVDGNQFVEKVSELGIKPNKALFLLVQFGFTENIFAELPKSLDAFQKLCEDSKCKKDVLNGIDVLVTFQFPGLRKHLSMILHWMYRNDILDEEAILTWAEQASKKYVSKEEAKKLREAASEFIDWLRTAESE